MMFFSVEYIVIIIIGLLKRHTRWSHFESGVKRHPLVVEGLGHFGKVSLSPRSLLTTGTHQYVKPSFSGLTHFAMSFATQHFAGHLNNAYNVK